jgi:uncharacterized protein (UPF0335 family)
VLRRVLPRRSAAIIITQREHAMARKKTDTDNGAKQARPAGNGFDSAKVQSYTDRIESLHADIASIMSAAMNECKSVHGDIKLVYDEAKAEAGIPKKALKKVIQVRALERKAEQKREELEGDDLETFDQIRHALGDLADLPLGKAALQRSDQPAV